MALSTSRRTNRDVDACRDQIITISLL